MLASGNSGHSSCSSSAEPRNVRRQRRCDDSSPATNGQTSSTVYQVNSKELANSWKKGRVTREIVGPYHMLW